MYSKDWWTSGGQLSGAMLPTLPSNPRLISLDAPEPVKADGYRGQNHEAKHHDTGNRRARKIGLTECEAEPYHPTDEERVPSRHEHEYCYEQLRHAAILQDDRLITIRRRLTRSERQQLRRNFQLPAALPSMASR